MTGPESSKGIHLGDGIEDTLVDMRNFLLPRRTASARIEEVVSGLDRALEDPANVDHDSLRKLLMFGKPWPHDLSKEGNSGLLELHLCATHAAGVLSLAAQRKDELPPQEWTERFQYAVECYRRTKEFIEKWTALKKR